MEGKIKRNGTIELWRFIFSLLIVMFHSNYIPSYFSGDYNWIKSQSIGVEFFFIVSGFLMAKSAQKYQDNVGTDTGKFILKKYLGILPVYLFAHIISSVVTIIIMPDQFAMWIFPQTESFVKKLQEKESL